MTRDEKTDPQGPLANYIAPRLEAMEARLKANQDANSDRIVRMIAGSLQRVAKLEREMSELDRRVSNLEEIVRSRADTEPPPPSGVQS